MFDVDCVVVVDFDDGEDCVFEFMFVIAFGLGDAMSIARVEPNRPRQSVPLGLAAICTVVLPFACEVQHVRRVFRVLQVSFNLLRLCCRPRICIARNFDI